VDHDTDWKDTFVNSEIYSVVQKQKKTSIKQGWLEHEIRNSSPEMS
jgi:hypothetical protein